MLFQKRHLTYLVTALFSTFISTAVSAYDAGDMIFRVGPTIVSPNDDSSGVVGQNTSLGLVSGDDGVTVEEGYALGFTFTYFLDSNFAIELLAATPFAHDIEGDGATSGLKVGEVTHLPPTLTLQWHPDEIGEFKPFVGLGINYTIFFDEETDAELTSTLDSLLPVSVTSTDLELDESIGWAINAGFDYTIAPQWNLSAEFWYIDIETDATVLVNGAPATDVEVTIDPLVALIGVSYQF
ncbi:MAG: OmpW family outer membrane protein [Pseudomonadota bacterium]